MGHPAHFHLYKNVIKQLKIAGHNVKIVISEKDILVKNLKNADLEYEVIALSDARKGLALKAKKILVSSYLLYKICKEFRPNLMIGCLTQMGFVGKILNIPTIFNAEDDISYTMLQGILTYPFISKILTPTPTNVGVFRYKRITYEGYHKLAYLHPKRFEVNDALVNDYFEGRSFVFIRLVNLNAYHDVGSQGISESVLRNIIDLLSGYQIVISSEKKLPKEFEKYKLKINENQVHHFLAKASLFIADSQSMTVEAAMLGVPNIKFNSFYGKISVLEELEKAYLLTIGVSPKEESKLYELITKMINNELNSEKFGISRSKMLNDKIDVSAFFIWFIENYPKSVLIMKENPDYQYNFQ